MTIICGFNKISGTVASGLMEAHCYRIDVSKFLLTCMICLVDCDDGSVGEGRG
jgi:hypothetical protein